jgi:hypothetical protein
MMMSDEFSAIDHEDHDSSYPPDEWDDDEGDEVEEEFDPYPVLKDGETARLIEDDEQAVGDVPPQTDSSPELRAVQALADQLMEGCAVEQDEQGFWLRCHLDSPVWLGKTVLRAKRALRGIARD